MRPPSRDELRRIDPMEYAKYDIGPVRAVYYAALCSPNGPEWIAERFPFGPTNELMGLPVSDGRGSIDPSDWHQQDLNISGDLELLGVRWVPLEQALHDEFARIALAKLAEVAPASHPDTDDPSDPLAATFREARKQLEEDLADLDAPIAAWYARQSLLAVQAKPSRLKELRASVEEAQRVLKDPVRQFLTQVPSAIPPIPEIVCDYLTEPDRDALATAQRYMPEIVGRGKGVQTDFPRAIARAAFAALWDGIDPATDPKNLPRNIQRVLYTRVNDDPDDPSYPTPAEWWQFLARILNHLPILFGTRTRKPLTGPAIRDYFTPRPAR